MTTESGVNQSIASILARAGQRQNYQQQAQDYIRQLFIQHAIGQKQLARNPLDPARMSNTSRPSLTPRELLEIQRRARIESPISPSLINFYGTNKAYSKSMIPKGGY